MKVSEITYKEVASYLRITDISDEEKSLLENLIDIAKAFIKGSTGVDDLDEFNDFVIVIYILCQDMYDNRTLYVDKSDLNKTVESILALHNTNNVC